MTDASTPAPFDFASSVRTLEQIQEEMKDSIVIPGRTRGQLKDAFDLVKDRTNWKLPIRARLPAGTDADQLTLIEDAVVFFTGGDITIERDADGVTVMSEGYYVNIGS